MKKIVVMTLLLICGMTAALAQKPAEIKFDKLTHDFGTFSEKNPVVTCTFTYTAVGDQSGCGKLWMHRSRVYQDSCKTRREG